MPVDGQRHFVKVASMKPLRLILLIACAVFAEFGNTYADEPQFFDSDGVRIAYASYGKGETVVVLHGLTGDMSYHSDLRRRLVENGFRVIQPDARGHGASDKPERYGTQMVDDVARLLDHLCIESTHLFGYSMGGDIADKFRELYPGRIRSLVLGGVGFSATGGWTTNRSFRLSELADSLEQRRGFEPLLSQPDAFGPGVLPQDKRSEVNESIMKNQDSRALAAVVREYAELQVDQNALAKNQIPTLLIVGALDAEAQDAKVLHSLMPNSSLVEIDGVDHGGAYSHEMLISKTLQFFLDHKKSK
jgi:pimeloyl-ACP methyl ester carboxylesterase